VSATYPWLHPTLIVSCSSALSTSQQSLLSL
jgi:hypothetical protein